ncbi:YchF/TatD family DNA exonuclease [Thalassotalea sp. M1531]|uniref:YchF/TatD family DNA exonuclease n=1 Tax=Thalassotalea algicola TaxID=2716224 RepID=A0A7Y0Q5V5_9GAMM|nr:TatD family hydrolase [Thalassotalea algicola]NMP30738.1 YchF/TatD family DNA exonuclease [Thalassotalea algicola]
MIDIGVNLTSARFDKDRAQVLEDSLAQGVTQLLITGTSVEESQQALQLTHSQPEILFSTAGVHPHYADQVSADYLSQITRLANHQQVKAIGECGLDFNRNFSTPENQIRVFNEQVELAAKLAMPLFLHQRDAFDAWIKILAPYLTKVPAMVSHCFTGNKSELLRCVDAGMYIGITGWVCDERRGAELQEAVKYLPLDRLMIETDAPYLTPRTIRPRPKSSRNEPKYLPYVVQAIAEIKQITEQEVIETSTNNAKRVFNL